MKISSQFPVVPQTSSPQKPKTTLPVLADAASPAQRLMPSSAQAFESASESARFFKTDGLSAFAQQALAAYQRTESLSPNNPRNQLVGIDDYA